MANKMQKAVKEVVESNQIKLYADKIICHGNGEMTFKKCYFYRHGKTATDWMDRVVQELGDAGFQATRVSTEDAYAIWPKSSYFVARVRVNR